MTAGVAPVDSADALTPGWLTAALRSGGHDCAVNAVRYEQIGSGQMGTSYRLRLDVKQPAGGDVPPTLVAKLAGGSPEARDRVKQGFQKEIRFYTDLLALTEVSAPRCWLAVQTDDLRSFTLLLDDLAPQVPGRQVDGCRPDQARAAVENLAGLHAPLWCHPILSEHSDWLTPMDAASGAFLAEILPPATEQFIERYPRLLPAQDCHTLREAAAVIGRWAALPARNFTLVHGDYRVDNLMFAPDRAAVTAVDWQTATSAPAARDLAYFLETSLHTDDRRKHEADLVRTYRDALAGRGVEYPAGEAWLDYRIGMVQGPFITVLGAIYATAERSAAADEMFFAMATRSCAAMRDLKTVDAIAEAEAAASAA